MPLCEYYRDGNDHDSIQYTIDEAGKAAGRLFKEVLLDDLRTFETREDYTQGRIAGQVCRAATLYRENKCVQRCADAGG